MAVCREKCIGELPMRFRLALIHRDHTARRRSFRSVNAKMEQAVSYRELWHETETNPVRIRGGEVGARVRKERVDGVPRKKIAAGSVRRGSATPEVRYRSWRPPTPSQNLCKYRVGLRATEADMNHKNLKRISLGIALSIGHQIPYVVANEFTFSQWIQMTNQWKRGYATAIADELTTIVNENEAPRFSSTMSYTSCLKNALLTKQSSS